VHDATRGVGQGKLRGLRANLQDSILNPRCVEFRHSALADLEAFRLDKVSRVGRDLIELVLQFRHKGVLSGEALKSRSGESRSETAASKDGLQARRIA
jgi:hypothetical protein